MLEMILFPAAVLAAMGLLFGVGLAVAAKKFAVEADERQERIVEVLPGANCGGCGYAGCGGYATAVVEGNAPVTGCPVGGSEVAAKIAEIMGVEAQSGKRMVARVICQGAQDVCGIKFHYEGLQDCSAANLIGDGFKKCRFACLGLGNCVRVCQFGALKVEKGLAVVDMNKCTACGKCVEACPKDCIRLERAGAPVLVRCRNQDKGKQVRDVCAKGCIDCKLCSKACKFGAVTHENNLPVMDYDKCVGCLQCEAACRMHTITAERPARHALIHKPDIGRDIDVDAICAFGALSVQDGKIASQDGKCVGCGECVRALPECEIELVEK